MSIRDGLPRRSRELEDLMILVTGATGTVGRAVIDGLLALDMPVRALARRPETARLPESVEVVRADLGEPDSLALHCAASIVSSCSRRVRNFLSMMRISLRQRRIPACITL